MGKTQVSAPAGLPFVDVSREFDAPRELVFRAWTEPELLVQWLGPRRLEMVIEHYEVRDGGRWRYVHRDTDGTEHWFHGVFHGTPSPDRAVQTFEYEGAPGHVSMDTLELEERDGRTIARTHSVFQSVEARDAMVEHGMAEGMNEGFDRLDEVLGRLRVAVA
jgi:uncharacterized protein YndB with AHSA1/START domain